MAVASLVVLKFGGELLDNANDICRIAEGVAALASKGPLVVVHGGGRSIDVELRVRGLEPKFVDGLRITDRAALDVALAVLAGRNNTALVAALCAAGCRAVGLTGADDRIGLSRRAPAFVSTAGESVDLGLVGHPLESSTTLIDDLTQLGYVPVIASIGVTADGDLLNVNADTIAAHFAAELQAQQLIIAGGTAGVLDADGRPVTELTLDRLDAMIASGEAHSGMVAKLAACRHALVHGVRDVSIVCGRDLVSFDAAPGTHIAAGAAV